jgi:hypothetical protein
MSTDLEDAQGLYVQLKGEAQQVYLEHIMSRTPPQLQAEMRELVLDDLDDSGSSEPDPDVAEVRSGDSVRVVTPIGGDIPGSPGLAAVSNSQIDFVQITAA